MNTYIKGFIPIPVLVALMISAVVGGFLGYKLGDGTFFSLGFGFGLALVFSGIVYKYAKPVFGLFGNQDKVDR